MNAPTPSTTADKPVPSDSEVEMEISKLVEQIIPQSAPHQQSATHQNDAERIRGSVARLTSRSVEGLEHLTSELQELQKFLKSEVERVQSEIESALAGIDIIIETIAPWKSAPNAPSPNARPVRAGPAANIEAAQVRR